MAFTDDAIRAKLSSLNESQDSISGVSQWIMFYRKHADRTAQVWMQKIKESPQNKKLCLIYLANEIVQQSRIRKKDEFVKAYLPIIVEATAAAYKGTSSETQNKIRRVVEVWRQRAVFGDKQKDIEAAIDEIDRSRSTRKPALGGSLFSSSSIPPELTTVAPLATTLQKADINAKPLVTTANQEYEKLSNPNNVPAPNLHAHGLAALVVKLKSAEGAVAESIKARHALIGGLEKLLASNKAKLTAEEAQLTDLNSKCVAIEGRRREVEDAILKGFTSSDEQGSAAPLSRSNSAHEVSSRPGRPQFEELTPPPVEAFTPDGSPEPSHVPDDILPEPVGHPIEPVAVPPPNGSASSIYSEPVTAIAGVTQGGYATHARPDETTNGAQQLHAQAFKKRKLSRSEPEDEFAAFAGDGDIESIDASLGSLI